MDETRQEAQPRLQAGQVAWLLSEIQEEIDREKGGKRRGLRLLKIGLPLLLHAPRFKTEADPPRLEDLAVIVQLPPAELTALEALLTEPRNTFRPGDPGLHPEAAAFLLEEEGAGLQVTWMAVEDFAAMAEKDGLRLPEMLREDPVADILRVGIVHPRGVYAFALPLAPQPEAG